MNETITTQEDEMTQSTSTFWYCDENEAFELAARTIDEAVAEAEAFLNGLDAFYGAGDERPTTVWFHGSICGAPTDEDRENGLIAGETLRQLVVRRDPPEPTCTAGAHDWQRPHEIVGGLVENPGVYGHGGSVIETSVCMHCGTARTWDGWATDPTNGEIRESLMYEPYVHSDRVQDSEESQS